MKIAIVNTVRTRRNGITNVICNLLSAMDREIRFDLICTSEPEAGYAEMMAQRGGQLHVVSRSMRDPMGYVRRLKDLLVREGYDAIHVHGNSATMALEMLAAKKAKCPVRIAHSHSTGCKYRAVHKLLWPVFQKHCTHRLACGEAAGKWLYAERDFTVVNNGIDTRRFAFDPVKRNSVRQDLGISPDSPVLGHVGIFDDNKNQSFLLDVLAASAADARLILLGDGAMRAAVEEKAAALGLADRVHFAGSVADVENYLSACDLFLLPSRFEGLPLSLVEAQASGLRCLVSDAVTREADMTGNIRFLPLDSPAAWAAAIEEIPADREAVSADAVKKIIARGYDVRTQGEMLKDYYRRAAEERGTER